jgi:hypothetical protein
MKLTLCLLFSLFLCGCRVTGSADSTQKVASGTTADLGELPLLPHVTHYVGFVRSAKQVHCDVHNGISSELTTIVFESDSGNLSTLIFDGCLPFRGGQHVEFDSDGRTASNIKLKHPKHLPPAAH